MKENQIVNSFQQQNFMSSGVNQKRKSEPRFFLYSDKLFSKYKPFSISHELFLRYLLENNLQTTKMTGDISILGLVVSISI